MDYKTALYKFQFASPHFIYSNLQLVEGHLIINLL